MTNKFSQLIAIASLTVAGVSLTSIPASAFDFSLESQSGNDYTYTITLDADDSLDVGDQLILTNLSGVTAATSNSPYTLVGFNDTSANFLVSPSAVNGAATYTGAISLTSPNSLSGLEYQAFFDDNGTPSVYNNASATATPVPFGVSTDLSILLLLGGFGLRKLKRKFS